VGTEAVSVTAAAVVALAAADTVEAAVCAEAEDAGVAAADVDVNDPAAQPLRDLGSVSSIGRSWRTMFRGKPGA
jgi:hypothetical protein